MGQIITVSILMPIYKVDQFLEKALISVFMQTYKNINYVFVIDGSPDKSLQILKDTINKCCVEPGRYNIIIHDNNEGIAKSRSDCIVMAKGDYVYFVDSDDWIEEDAVEQMVSATKDGSVDIVGCDYMKDFQTGKTTYYRENYGVTCVENLHRCINYDIATVLWKLLVRRKLFTYFTIDPINIGEDYIISIKLFYFAKSFISLNKAFYHYVQYNQNRLSFQSLRSIRDHIKCVKVVENFIKEKGFFDDEIQHRILLRKFNIKSNFVLNNMLLDEKSYNNTFPEANGVWQEMGYSRKEKIKFWLAENGLFALLKLIQH